MFFLSFASSFVLACILQAAAVPHPAPHAMRRADISVVTKMTSTQLDEMVPYAHFASAAYCSPILIKAWKCGYYVGYWPTENSVVVAHEGTDPTKFLADLTDAYGLPERLDSTLFPGVGSDVKLHSGFADEHKRTASIILNEVKSLISQYNATSVTLVGHSLGAALAEIECVFMALNLPSSIAIKGVTFGTPRVGNPAWAAFFDSLVPDFQRINHKKDIVPVVPARYLGFSHVHGEVHILSDGDAVQCPGDDDAMDLQCTIRSVPTMFLGNIVDHLGPYQGVFMGSCL
ncbi:Alpha/Beta hydrolase protein [Suillus subalutaceus]|uniref:Alpha/Beta hydrolase protein n=1 Tax=Suillus subalutaceus TaxID=48586 RepID=UPI001B8601CB|nr:Alpha/Beta hydrolase protein [Suillus subalutaceus]KAG1872459.1 Alpha/Beta hydrolase protein [Suillus subalutaceus]